jgi:hypothetical protein
MSGVKTYFPITHVLEEVSVDFGFSKNLETANISHSLFFGSIIQ